MQLVNKYPQQLTWEKIGVNPEVEVPPFKIPEILICEKSYFWQ